MTETRNDPAARAPIRLALVGIGKIARDQHVPALRANPAYDLTATASRSGSVEGVPAFYDIDALVAQGPKLDAVSLCTPAAGRHAIAAAAIRAGLHVMLEKPPTATLAEVADLARLAKDAGVTLFTTWHSRAAPGVAPARAWLAERRIDAVRIVWKEDIRRWHPGQEWILGTGGFGVFDPGINALSIVTAILPQPVLLRSATMDVPEGRASPIAATLTGQSGTAPVTADFDFLQTGPQSWDIEVDTDAGCLRLALGGSQLTLPGEATRADTDAEYPTLYARFAELVASGLSDVDATPLQLVADAYLIAERRTVAPFAF
jgi:D-galactose 1-dehydrogenase